MVNIIYLENNLDKFLEPSASAFIYNSTHISFPE